MLRDELARTVGKGQSKNDLLQKPNRSSAEEMILTESSTDQEVQMWLEYKGFSIRTMQILEGQSGATLFSLSKKQLQEFCGKDEVGRLYSQLLAQKNITGFTTKAGAELAAIFQLRKAKADDRATLNKVTNGEPPAPGATPKGDLSNLFDQQNASSSSAQFF